jgi:hypothetical protein
VQDAQMGLTTLTPDPLQQIETWVLAFEEAVDADLR